MATLTLNVTAPGGTYSVPGVATSVYEQAQTGVLVNGRPLTGGCSVSVDDKKNQIVVETPVNVTLVVTYTPGASQSGNLLSTKTSALQAVAQATSKSLNGSNGWVAGQPVWTFANGTATVNAPNTNYVSGGLVRPQSEASYDHGISGTVLATASIGAGGSPSTGVELKHLANGDHYIGAVSTVPGSPALNLYRITGGNAGPTWSLSVPLPSNIDATRPLSFVGKVENNPPMIDLAFSYGDTGAAIGRMVGVDSSTGFLTGPGTPGLAAWDVANGVFSGVSTLARSASVASPFGILLMSDSFYDGSNAIGQRMAGHLARGLQARGVPPLFVNRAVAGKATADWLPGGALYQQAVAAALPASYPVAFVALGMNDSNLSYKAAATTYVANCQSIAVDLLARGYKLVVFALPTFADAKNLGSGLTAYYDATCPARVLDYHAALPAIDNGSTVRVGGSEGFFLIASDPTVKLQDGVHPTDIGAAGLGDQHAALLFSCLAGAGLVNA